MILTDIDRQPVVQKNTIVIFPPSEDSNTILGQLVDDGGVRSLILSGLPIVIRYGVLGRLPMTLPSGELLPLISIGLRLETLPRHSTTPDRGALAVCESSRRKFAITA